MLMDQLTLFFGRLILWELLRFIIGATIAVAIVGALLLFNRYGWI